MREPSRLLISTYIGRSATRRRVAKVATLAERALLGESDLRDWAEDGDLLRAEIRLLPVVNRFASDPDAIRKSLGEELSQRLRAFIQGQALTVEAMRRLLDDLNLADGSAPPAKDLTDAISARGEATIDKIAPVDWSS